MIRGCGDGSDNGCGKASGKRVVSGATRGGGGVVVKRVVRLDFELMMSPISKP